MTSTDLNGYRLLTYRESGRRAVAGVLVGDRVYPATSLLEDAGIDASSVLSILESWQEAHQLLLTAIRGVTPEEGRPLTQTELLAPILYPRAIFCAGANYWDHVEEMVGKAVDRTSRPKDPWFFLKPGAHSVVGDQADVHPLAQSQQLDYEAELAVVIGKQARDVPAGRAKEVIAGYTILNDLSARDLMARSDRSPVMAYDWMGQKCFDGAAPMGPWITPADYVEDCHDLAVKLWVNDVLKQDSNTKQMIHNSYEQIEWLSHQLTLLPGDVIATGTPAGVGMPRGDFLAKGDVVRIEIESCGELTTMIA